MKEIIRAYNQNEHKLIGIKAVKYQNNHSAIVKQKNIPSRLIKQINH
jgi:hypothetical protein